MLVVAACSSDIDLGGTYMVTADVSSSPCGNDAPVTPSPAYLKLHEVRRIRRDDLVVRRLQRCRGHLLRQQRGIFGGFSEPIDDGWKGVGTGDSFSGTECYLFYSHRHRES